MLSFDFLIGHLLLEESADQQAWLNAAIIPHTGGIGQIMHWDCFVVLMFIFIFNPSNDHHSCHPKRFLINQ